MSELSLSELSSSELSLSALILGYDHALLLDEDGVIEEYPLTATAKIIAERQPIICHARAIGRQIGQDISAQIMQGRDILTLFAFVLPARACVPTPAGVAWSLGLSDRRSVPDMSEQALLLLRSANALLDMIDDIGGQERPISAAIARTMSRAGWAWGDAVLTRLADQSSTNDAIADRPLLAVWDLLPEWSESENAAANQPPRHIPVTPNEARQKLAGLLRDRGDKPREDRPQQADYASALCTAFQPRSRPDQPQTVLAEAGTGIGKTLGYLAPALVWSERNEAPVWISTYTRHLQNQIDTELNSAFANPAEKAKHVVIRKGRENYLCLLNLEEATNLLATAPHYGIAIGLMLRWVMTTRQGDVMGGDLPGWLPDIVGRGRSQGLADRRGECIYAACPHYRRCFIERNIQQSRQARIVVANHALVMVQSALRGAVGRGGEAEENHTQGAITRLIFDEGHHVFDAADNAFATHFTGDEGQELRRWLIGIEGGRRSRSRGLRRRLEEYLTGNADLEQTIEQAMQAARILPDALWYDRVINGEPLGKIEAFLAAIHQQIRARTSTQDQQYGLECDPLPAEPIVLEQAVEAKNALAQLSQPLKRTAYILRGLLADDDGTLNSDQRRRIDALAAGIECRVAQSLEPWQSMLDDLITQSLADPDGRDQASSEQQGRKDHTSWFALSRSDQQNPDIGYYRHWIDATRPFALSLGHQVHGMVITSATLTDGTEDDQRDWQRDWQGAEQRSGTRHWIDPPIRARLASPYNYPDQTRVYIIQDVRKDDLDQVAGAFRALFLAAGGGGLGIFTAIQRLRAVHQRIAHDMDHAAIPLYAQHIDGMDVATLVDMFRFDPDSCLLGTDAVRDGVDVPGNALRMLVFDRVPWPRPDILHRARRAAFGGWQHDDRMTRLRLKQAFGRLVRRGDDRGVFVLLDPMMPSRLYRAFPPGVAPQKCGLAEAITDIKKFFDVSPVHDKTKEMHSTEDITS